MYSTYQDQPVRGILVSSELTLYLEASSGKTPSMLPPEPYIPPELVELTLGVIDRGFWERSSSCLKYRYKNGDLSCLICLAHLYFHLFSWALLQQAPPTSHLTTRNVQRHDEKYLYPIGRQHRSETRCILLFRSSTYPPWKPNSTIAVRCILATDDLASCFDACAFARFPQPDSVFAPPFTLIPSFFYFSASQSTVLRICAQTDESAVIGYRN
ncbi:hypothetical protein KQX54_008061 [Cotesia glomerata]|uniref:Uncharacterized protein n=1 Tax=Cotesia glomerata TaxID=32391 RepID=A0AAV7I6I2_COTGL|nr:hypothetical protein KQX54_008061 [Cotesia glomerata]